MTRPRLNSATRITLLYIVLGGLWVFLADRVIHDVTRDPDWLTWLDTWKGWILVGLTAPALYIERRRSDSRLQRLATILISSDDAIIGATVDGIVTAWNPGAERLYGQTRRAALGYPLSSLLGWEHLEDAQAVLERVRNGETVRRQEVIRLDREGRRQYISLTLAPIQESTRRVIGMSVTARDITERVRAEEAQRMAEVGRLASGLVHEVRNPLNAMRMQIAVIRNKLRQPNEQNLSLAAVQLERLEAEVLRVKDLASDFLAYGRPAPDHVETFDAVALARDVAEFVTPDCEQRGVTVLCTCKPAPDDAGIQMDRGKLRQVLLNLVQNARQAMPNGGLLTILAEPAGPREMRISVTDTGCGIAPDRLPNIFDAFYSTKDGGTGLGLAIVKRTLESAGGRVEVQSKVDGGTSFELYLPVVNPGAGSLAAESNTAAQS